MNGLAGVDLLVGARSAYRAKRPMFRHLGWRSAPPLGTLVSRTPRAAVSLPSLGSTGPSVSRLVVLLLTLALAAAGCTSGSSAAADCDLPGVRSGLCLTAPDARQPAPTGSGPVLGSEDGETTSLEEHRGRPVVVNVWGSWCGPCRVEQPELNAVAERFADAVTFLGINIQDPSPANALAFVREFETPYPSIHDPAGSFAATFDVGPTMVPSTILVDAEGDVAARIIGATTATELSVLLSRLLEEG